MTPHEFVEEDGWWVCLWCKRTGKDRSLFDKINCQRPDSLRVDDGLDKKAVTPLDAVLMTLSKTVNDNALTTADPKVVYQQVSKEFMHYLDDKKMVLLEEPTITTHPMTTVPGYTIFKAAGMTAQGVEVRVSRNAPAMSTSARSLGTYSALSGGSNMLRDIMQESVAAEVRRRNQHVVVGDVHYSHLPYGSDQIVVTATFMMIPKKLFQEYGYAATLHMKS